MLNDILAKLSWPNYCESQNFTFVSEPLNVISNIAFFVASYAIFRLLKKYRVKGWGYYGLLILTILIGFGSLLWHSVRTPYSLLLDAIPIFMFLGLTTYILLRTLFRNSAFALLGSITLIAFQVLPSQIIPHDSVRHLLFASVFGVLMIWVNQKYGTRVMYQGLIILASYLLAIFFRSIDTIICPQLNTGTHFLWHILNAANTYFVTWYLLQLRISNVPPRRIGMSTSKGNPSIQTGKA